MNLRKIWLIAKREFLYNLRRRSFLFTAILMPLISIGGMMLVISLINQSIDDISVYKRVGIVDQAHVFTDQNGTASSTLEEPFFLITDQQNAEQQLRERQIQGYYVIPVDYMQTGKVDSYTLKEPTFNDAIGSRFNKLLHNAIAGQLGNTDVVKRLSDPTDEVAIYKIGNPQKLSEMALFITLFVPMIFVILVFSVGMATSQFLVSGLVEEKENRMMEVYITSSRPIELLWGKILGLCALGLFQLLIWAVMGLGIASLTGQLKLNEVLGGLDLSPQFFAMLLVYFLLGYLLLGTLLGGFGALANAEQEGRQIASLISLVTMIPLFGIATYFIDPNGPWPRFFSLFPLTAPMGMILRVAWTTVPTSDIVLSIGLLIISILLLVWVSAGLMRMGMLNYGKRFSPLQIVRGLFGDRREAVTSTTSEVVS